MATPRTGRGGASPQWWRMPPCHVIAARRVHRHFSSHLLLWRSLCGLTALVGSAMMLSHGGEGGGGVEGLAATRSAALFEASKGVSPPPVAIAVTEAAVDAKVREERTVLLAGFDAVEAGQQGTEASVGGRCGRCCASRRPPAGWRVALGAAAVWALVMLAGWTAVVVAQRSRAAAPPAMRSSSTLSLAARTTALADICDPLELEACAGSQPWWNGGIVYQARWWPSTSSRGLSVVCRCTRARSKTATETAWATSGARCSASTTSQASTSRRFGSRPFSRRRWCALSRVSAYHALTPRV